MIAVIGEHLVRVGVMGQVGRFHSPEPVSYPRGTSVVCRTVRGLEIGEVLAGSSPIGRSETADGQIVRCVTVQDELLIARLHRHREEAFAACVKLLDQQGISAVLMDVEHLFDGRGLYFYFLGEVPDQVERLMAHLAEAYDTEVQFRRFVEAAEVGCGPLCGTEEAAGCDSGACATCVVGSGCGTRRS